MQASGEEQPSQQQHARGNGVGGQTMSRHGSSNSGYGAASPGSTATASGEAATKQLEGGTGTTGQRLKIRLGGSSLNNRATSVSSEGTNGAATPRATSPAAVRPTNGHTDDEYRHQQANGTAMDKGMSGNSIKQEEFMVSKPMGEKAGSSNGEAKMQNEHSSIPTVVETEEMKRYKEEQFQKDVAELPAVAHQSLVPLYELVRRLVARSYTDLQSIVEVLPSQSDFDRKRTIIEYVITTRRQIIKLLVLLRWAKENTQDTERSINLIAFLQRQNYQLERAVQALQGVEGLLAGARVRNYDLITAVEVLTTGTYSQLPSLFKDSFIPPPKLTNDAVVALLQDLESVIRLRLQLHEHIPVQLLRRPYRIHDGRVTFHCPGYFKAAFTLGGDSPTDQWYLVDFNFDIRGRDVQQHPTGAMREHILQVCNTRLSECAAKEKEERDNSAESRLQHEQKGLAFVQTFSVMQDLCLNYQMELLHYHAIQTNNTPTIWQGMLGISFSKDRKTIEIRNQALSKGPLPSPQYGPELRFEELLTITKGPRPQVQSVKAISARLIQLAERCATVRSIDTSTAEASFPTSKEAISSPPVLQDCILNCTFSREAMFIDSKGKKVPPPVQRKVDMRKVEYTVSIIDESAGKQSIRDVELVLGQCFSLKASMIPQQV